jgi:hypothetical protein
LASYPGTLSEPCDTRQDLVCRSGPDEWFGIFVVNLDVLPDGVFQLFDAAEDTTTNALVGDLSKPAFDQIQPGTVSGREMDMETGPFGQPVPDDGCLVRSVIIHHHVDIEPRGYVGLDGVEKISGIPANGDADATAR